VGGASVNQPSDKNIPDVYQILLQNQLLMQNLLLNQTVSVSNTNSKRSATASCTVSKETEVRQKRQKTDDRHAHRHHVKPALADNYSKELDKLFGTDSECENIIQIFRVNVTRTFKTRTILNKQVLQKIPNRSRERQVMLITMRTLRLLNL
jgi:CTP synthase (UTP-ammonia lyase)